ncbi:TetR/AcrR family transcriptional regulator [Roseateles chitinivorans]|uniref:TetR/AcrR family transcriptional regulator n=1 Tax=Roseateles chitinivorans TaxID=2917965 RepID=UPI003D674CD7
MRKPVQTETVASTDAGDGSEGGAAPRGRGRPRDPGKRLGILAAAREHFAEVGFDKGSVDRVAAAASVSKVTVYKYFPSKEVLFNAVVNEPIRQAFELDLAALDPTTPQASLEKIAETYLTLITAPEILAHIRLLHASVSVSPALGHDFFNSGPEAVMQELGGFLRACRDAGSLKIRNAPQAAEQFLGMVRGNEQARLLMGQPALRGKAATRAYCRACVGLFVRAYAA